MVCSNYKPVNHFWLSGPDKKKTLYKPDTIKCVYGRLSFKVDFIYALCKKFFKSKNAIKLLYTDNQIKLFDINLKQFNFTTKNLQETVEF